MSEFVIKVENLSKRYTIQHGNGADGGLRHAIQDLATAPLRWLLEKRAWSREQEAKRTEQGTGSMAPLRAPRSLLFTPSSPLRAPSSEEFWALEDVSFEVKQGEVVGIIGRNGAGKSTLLKILSRITEPTTGRVRIRGRVASLLEVGTGFHPELTGRENIFVNGAVLGMTRVEIKRKFDEIVAFAEVEKFIDTPVKRYSSGMYVRLAFAVAAHLEPEILLVDEVLAVGDAQFQKRCLGKMGEVAKGGRTVLFVSHNLIAMQNLCSRAIFLDAGVLQVTGVTGEVVHEYLSRNHIPTKCKNLNDVKQRKGSQEVKLTSVEILNNRGDPNSPIRAGDGFTIKLGFSCPDQFSNVAFAVSIYNEMKVPVFAIHTTDLDFQVPKLKKEGFITLKIKQANLMPGRYWIDVAVGDETDVLRFDHIVDALLFDVEAADPYRTGKLRGAGWTTVFLPCEWHVPQ